MTSRQKRSMRGSEEVPFPLLEPLELDPPELPREPPEPELPDTLVVLLFVPPLALLGVGSVIPEM